MGVLDDAIREHLELKRRHGASDDEIARKEAEALGPARRGPAPEPAEPAEPVAETEPVAAEDAPAPAAVEPTIDVPAEPVPPAAIEESTADPAGAEPVGEAEPPGSPAHIADDPAVADAAPEPVEADLPPVHEIDRDPVDPPAPVPGATVEFDTLSAPDEEPAADGDEDVLEETPEFLRETPEHDRLWFEQKPPRDFDLED